jgi:hypothetical protein
VCLPSKHEALSSNPIPPKTTTTKNLPGESRTLRNERLEKRRVRYLDHGQHRVGQLEGRQQDEAWRAWTVNSDSVGKSLYPLSLGFSM